MQQPPEERAAFLEAAAERHEQTMARLDAVAGNQERLLDRLGTNREALQARQETLQATEEASRSLLERIAGLLEELRRDAAVTRRLWLRLSRGYGWSDDEQNGAQPGTST